MTSQEVRALIDAKIKGQGTAVDAGSVLPAILTGILDLIEQGGGGGTADAVQYIPQELTAPQQMQARKNQGLYYSEGGGEDVTINWDGDTTGLETVGGLYKVSEDAPSASEVKSVSMIQNGVGQTYEVGVSPAQIVEIEGGYAIGSLACLVITADEVSVQGTTYTKGIWFVYGNENNRTSQLVYGQTETIHHIEPKYIKDMYYEESVVKTMYYDMSGDMEGEYRKVSNEVIEANSVIGHKFTSSNGTEYTITEDMVIAADSTHPTRILYDASDPNDWAILIFPEDMEFEGEPVSKGVWFRDTGTFYNPNHIESLEYEGVTVHQIPAKYIPSTGLDVFEIKVSQDILYGEPLEVENVTYQDIMDACSAGKYIVLTIMADDDIGVQGRCLGGNFSRMENTGGSIYGQPCYCFAGAYRQHSSGSSGQFGSYSLKDVVLYEDANDGLLYVELQNCNYNG